VRSPTVEASRWIGRVLRDKWRIDARIARGGVGTVWQATHKNNGSVVAIKLLHPEFSRDEDTRSRFLQEGYAANHVGHPGVVRILDDDVTEEGLAFLVMELLEGELLEKRRVAKGGRLAIPEVYEVADQLLDVLAAAHEKGIVHRDIKPDNLFLTKEGKLKVLDFGFAQMKTGFRKEQTATGYLLGTPGFMAPEQAVGNRAEVDARTDIWAVGATLFTLLSGSPVHEGESAAEMLVAAANYSARPLMEVAPFVPPKLAQIVDKALMFEKEARFTSARAMQSALRAVPGRTSVGPNFESGRRSIPPEETQSAFDDKTVAQKVEELDPNDLQDRAPSWQSAGGERTLAVSNVNVPKAAMPSGYPPPRKPTSTPPPPVAEPVQGDRTLVMVDAPAHPPPATQPFGERRGKAPSFSNTPQAFAVQTGEPRDMMFVAGPARPPPPAPEAGRSKALVYLGVAVLSMVIVVVTGLIILAATD